MGLGWSKKGGSLLGLKKPELSSCLVCKDEDLLYQGSHVLLAQGAEDRQGFHILIGDVLAIGYLDAMSILERW